MDVATSNNKRFGGAQVHSCLHCSQIGIICFKGGFRTRRKNRESDCMYTYEEVEQAGHDGCPLFIHRLNSLKASNASSHRPSLCFSITPADQDFAFVNCEWLDDDLDNDFCDKLSVLELEGAPILQSPISRPLNPDPRSMETANKIHYWANTCRTSHPRCANERKKRQSHCSTPARLLYIGTEECKKVTLHEIISPGKDGELNNLQNYAALTYCWGGSNINFLLTTKSVGELRRGISISDLPATIQHAIQTARNMNIPYIWIDALCIFQDDEEDKKRELPKMAGIYYGAFVVISAAVASNCQQGFLQPRNLVDLLKIVYKLPYQVDEHRLQESFVLLSEGSITDEHHDYPIDQRAWTLQEHLQAVALLRFGSRQVTWTCKTIRNVDGGTYVSEESTEFDPEVFDGKYHERFLQNPADLEFGYGHTCEHWKQFVGHYTKRSLSESVDMLPAFSTIAQNYARTTVGRAGRYCAGLWENDLPHQMLWFKPKPILNATDTRKSPTWSWASLPGSVLYRPSLDLRISNLKVINVEMELYDDKWPYGRVNSASVLVEGILRLSIWPTTDFPNTNCEVTDLDASSGGNLYLDTDAKQDMNLVYYLEIVPAVEKHEMSYGLVLCGLKNGKYQRIGYYECCGWLTALWDEIYAGGSATIHRSCRIIIL